MELLLSLIVILGAAYWFWKSRFGRGRNASEDSDGLYDAINRGMYFERMKNFFTAQNIDITKENIEVSRLIFTTSYMHSIFDEMKRLYEHQENTDQKYISDINHMAASIALIKYAGLMLFDEQYTESMLSNTKTKERRTSEFLGTLGMTLNINSDALTAKDINALELGKQIDSRLAIENAPLLQSIYDDWTYTFHNTSADRLPSLVNSHQKIEEFAKTLREKVRS